MLAEFVRQLEALALRASEPRQITITGLPRKAFVFKGDAPPTVHDLPPPARDHEIDAYGSFVRAVTSLSTAGGLDAPMVFHSNASVVALLNRKDRQDQVVMRLDRTKRFAKLAQLAAATATLKVPDAVRMIRFELQGVGAEALLAALRGIDFKRTDGVAFVVEHGRESLGRSVEARVGDPARVPETFVARVRPWQNRGLETVESVVECGVWLDVEGQGVRIVPLADEVEQALEDAQERLGSKLAEDLPGALVLAGSP